MSTPLKVTAVFKGPTSGIVGNPFMLDGPLAWAEAISGKYPPATREHAPEIPLPLEKWEEAGLWGWKCSQALYEVQGFSGLEVRRKPSDNQLRDFTKEKRNHHAMGPYKAKDLTFELSHIPEISWELVVTNRDWFDALLQKITHLGGQRARGLGEILSWKVEEGTPDGWKNRPFTTPCRAPYWHKARINETPNSKVS